MLIELLRLRRKRKCVDGVGINTTSCAPETPSRNTQIKRSILALYEMGTLDLDSTQALITAFGVGDA